MFLMDTDVVSALRRPERNPAPTRWLEAQQASDVYLSVITMGEIERGIARQTRQNPDFARDLAQWYERILSWFADRILPVDVAIASRWGRLSASVGNESVDLFIAATALEHGFTVATRNVRDFAPTGVSVLNPFEDNDD
ncbi:MAG: type II toxin-antitoxin system VapC family toxin [Chloroflexi bacterium]|nr:type II toxin-antitoxin system VapC family toxin [Chloroflexota bacterium]MYD49820.1 type II toxin-antitoxin system VapC family toxin [Chloroflexota bacterium]